MGFNFTFEYIAAHLLPKKFLMLVMGIFSLVLLVGVIPAHCEEYQSSGTKWCSDAAGNNFLCSDGPSGEGETYYLLRIFPGLA